MKCMKAALFAVARRSALFGLLACGCKGTAQAPSPAPAPDLPPPLARFEFSTEKMATELKIVCYAATHDAAATAVLAAFLRVDEIEQELSDWRESSEVAGLRRACANGPAGPLPASADLVAVLQVAQRVAAESNGAFDVTVGPLVELWRRARRREELPGDAALRDARARVGFENVEFDAAQRTVTFKIGGVRLDFGGIAKGFAADAVLQVLAAHGITRALAAAGGDIAVADPPPDSDGWRIELAGLDVDTGADDGPPPPRTLLSLAHAAVSTSGDTWRYVEIDGVRYSHVVDPRTGMGLTRRVLSSVVAPDGATADALATATDVVGPELGLALVARFAGSEARIVTLENGRPRACASPGFARMMRADR
jgi:thiamine biosynthesis lipoprotein